MRTPIRSRRRSSLFAAVATAGTLLSLSTSAHACGPESYLGTICTFGMNYCPKNWAPTNGAMLAISQYQALFALLSCKYGGDCRTNFALPDLRGRSAVGTGQGPGLSEVTWGQQIGDEEVTLGVPLPEHSHQATFVPGGGSGGTISVAIPAVSGSATTNVPGTGVNLAATSPDLDLTPLGGPNGPVNIYSSGTPDTTLEPFDLPVAAIGGGSVVVGPSGIVGATMTVPTRSPGLGVTTCIMIDGGVFPPRG
jgi:microcystin-dependent protein